MDTILRRDLPLEDKFIFYYHYYFAKKSLYFKIIRFNELVFNFNVMDAIDTV